MLQKFLLAGAIALGAATTLPILSTPVEAGSNSYRNQGDSRLLRQPSHRINSGKVRGLATTTHNTKKEPGYPTPGKAYEACGAGNVFVVYVESPTLGNSEHRYDCAD